MLSREQLFNRASDIPEQNSSNISRKTIETGKIDTITLIYLIVYSLESKQALQ